MPLILSCNTLMQLMAYAIIQETPSGYFRCQRLNDAASASTTKKAQGFVPGPSRLVAGTGFEPVTSGL